MSDSSQLAPVVLFVYARPDHTRQTLEALAKNRLADQTQLYVYSDASKNESTASAVAQVRQLIRSQQWCGQVEIIEAGINLGLAESIKRGVSEVVNRHGRVIVLEDDLVTSPGFLEYMNTALFAYESTPAVRHINAYCHATPYESLLPETFFTRYMQCWGWGTWEDSWERARWDVDKLIADINASEKMHKQFNLGGCNGFSNQLLENQCCRIKTWAIFWAASIFLQDGLCLSPRRSLVRNIGVDGTGENFTQDVSSSMAINLTDSICVRKRKAKISRLGEFSLQQSLRWGSTSTWANHLKGNLGRWKHRLWKKMGLLQ
ncbi:glycosyltransferase family 2 protein [Cerasicoccus arenae]|nr:glycosyltransferase [Cerasicoccus arenae]MBK1857046.1 glycosyltransferase [Cerasicoccus arenae]